MAKDTGNAQGVGGSNKAVPLGAGPKSGNEALGMDSRYTGGTTGSRPEMSARYGGDSSKGEFFKGQSAAPVSKETNSGGGEKPSESSGQYGPGGADWLKGTYGSRENMPKYGGGPATPGKLVGAGAGATKSSSGPEQVKRDLPTQMDTVKGTSAGEQNMAKSEKGIGKPGKMGARM